MEENNYRVNITTGVKAFSFSAFIVSLLLTAVMFITVSQGLSILNVLIACLVTLFMLFSVIANRSISKYLLFAYLMLISGVTLFYIVFGVGPFFSGIISNVLLVLPAMAVAIFIYYLNKFTKPKNQLIFFIVLSVALIFFSIELFIKMNLRIRPQVASLQEGHDEFLSSLRYKDTSHSPNILLIFMDDLGYGDISAYGNTAINTPNIDYLVENGVLMENFYAASPVCTPSRFALLTGRYAARGHLDEVLMPTVISFKPLNPFRHWNPIVLEKGVDGILPDEITIAEALQSTGYATGIFGKWHLGDYGDYLPNAKGFDYFYGSYYSNDMHPYEFYRNEEKVIEHPLDQTEITRNLTSEIISFITENRDNRFFVYYPTPWPHDPLYASDSFYGTSSAGLYGDCMQEFDSSLGEIFQTLKDYNLFHDTLIIFTSDNGPWHEGNAGNLRGRKGNFFDGGHKVPFIACYTPMLPPGTRIATPAMNIDIFPTILNLCGLPLPADRIIDGIDIIPLLKGEENAPTHEALYYMRGGKTHGIKSDGFKYFDRLRSENSAYITSTYRDFLFNLGSDPSESYNVNDHYPEKAEILNNKLSEFRRQMESNPRGIL